MSSSSDVAEIAAWDEPPSLAVRGTVIVVPGRGEHPGLYRRFGQRISADAYRVRVVPNPITDENSVRTSIRELVADADPATPVLLTGSDGGALFAAGLVSTREVSVAALLLVGLPVQNLVTLSDGTQEIEERTACSAHRQLLSTDADFVPGAIIEPLPKAWFDAADLSRVTVPILGLHGRADTISLFETAREQYRTAPKAELVGITGGLHDTLNDQTHRTVAATVVLFLERLRLGADLPEIARREPLS